MKYVVSLREYYESGESLVFGTDSLLEAENYALFCAIGHLDDYLTYLYEVSEKPKLLCSFSAESDYAEWKTTKKSVLKSINKEAY